MGKKKMNRRAYALNAALGAVSRRIAASGATSVDVSPEEVLAYAKFILGKPAKKKHRRGRSIGTAYVDLKLLEPSPVPGLSPAAWEAALKTAEKAGRSREEAEKHLNKCSLCRELAEKDANGELFTVEEAAAITDTPLQEEPDATSGQPIGEDPGDRDVLLAWTEEVKRRNAEQEAAMEARELEKASGDTLPPAADDGRAFWNARPELNGGDSLEVKNEEDGTTVVRLDANSTPEEKREAEERLGLVSGALDEDLTFSSVDGLRFPDGTPAEKARAEELKRRRRRDDALGRGRAKLHERSRSEGDGTGRDALGVPLDEDELLAVAGNELYPAMDEEPSREVKIRNRKGEVRTFAAGGRAAGGREESAGWAVAPLKLIRLPWTSSEMVRRGPWHVV